MPQLRHSQCQEKQRQLARPPLFRSTVQPQQALGLITPTQLFALRASGRQVTWGKMGKGRWRQGTGAKDVEEGRAAVVAPSMPGESETSSASIAVAMDGAASLGGKSDAAAEDGADIESCMFMKVGFLPQMQNRSCGLR